MGPWHSQQQLPIDSLGPIISSAAVVDALGWAHGIYNSSCRFIHLGPLFYRQVLLMPPDGPITFTTAAAASFTWAHYFSAAAVDALGWAHGICNGSCQLICLGPYFFQQVLSMPSDGLIAFTTAAAD